MTQSLLHHLGVNSLAQEQGCVNVAEVMEPDPRQASAFEHPLEVAPHNVVRPQRLAVRLAKN
jgi:hypothetical protein